MSNPMSCAGINYRNLLDRQGNPNIEPLILEWDHISRTISNTIDTLNELVNIRDGYLECNEFSTNEINLFITHICIN